VELRAQIKQYAVYIDQSVLDMPGREFHEIEFPLPKRLKEQYTLMKNELYVELVEKKGDDGESLKITAPSVAAKLNKLNQITSGFVIDTEAINDNKFLKTDKEEWHMLDPYRFEYLEQFLNAKDLGELTGNPKLAGKSLVGQQVVIWAYYRKEFETIKKLLGDKCALVYGGVTGTQQEQAIQDYMDGKIQYLVANPASADKGLTLTMGHAAIYFSLSYSYELFKQSAERIYGAIRSQPEFCDYYIFMALYTVEPIIYRDVLTGKATASKSIMNHLKPTVVFP
jgi:hypothetical protein